jgi:hypothetical protein
MKHLYFYIPQGRIAEVVSIAKGLFTNNVARIALRFGSDLVVAISVKPQA